ncbi:MAG TPA: DUF2807 domain-containing protein, partial [Bacteroidia bacterium]|nr:DUF2807 domain-containing protein [Bacteroidia bacterium]
MTSKNKILITALACCAVLVSFLGIYRFQHSFVGYSAALMLDSKIHPDLKYTKLPPEGKNIPVQSFRTIKAKGAFNILLQHGTTESLVMKGYDPGDLKVTNVGDTLMLMFTDSSYSSVADMKTNIYITYKQLNRLKMYLMGDIKTLDTIKAGLLTIESNGFGEKTLTLNADTLIVTLDGAGTIDLFGKANYADFKVNGMDSLRTKSLKVDVLHTFVYGIGAATVTADSEIYLKSYLGG